MGITMIQTVIENPSVIEVVDRKQVGSIGSVSVLLIKLVVQSEGYTLDGYRCIVESDDRFSQKSVSTNTYSDIEGALEEASMLGFVKFGVCFYQWIKSSAKKRFVDNVDLISNHEHYQRVEQQKQAWAFWR